jgi:hypothetical protein
MHLEFWIILGILIAIIVFLPLGWALWVINTAAKHRRYSQGMVYCVFFTAGLPKEALCHKRGIRIIPPKEIRPPIKEDSDGPGYYLYSSEAKTDFSWPPGKSKKLQVPIERLFFDEGNPYPKDPHKDFIPYESTIMLEAIANEKSTSALMARMQAESRDAMQVENGIKNLLLFSRYQLIASVITVVAIIASIVLTLLTSNKAQTVLESLEQIKSGLGIGA